MSVGKTIRIVPERDAAAPAFARAHGLVGLVLAERYRVDAVLSARETGAVVRAQHLGLHKPVVLKVLHPGAPTADVARLDRETLARAHVSHPNIAMAMDAGALADGGRYVAIEYIAGATLREALETGPLSTARALRVARSIATALRAMHQRGIVHRDLEPCNVMLSGSAGEEVKLIDLGSARIDPAQLAVDASGDDGSVARAASSYTAPEAARGAHVLDERSDVYSLGVLLHEMLGGTIPLVAGEHEGPKMPGPRGREVDAVVRHLCAPDREARCPTAAAALFALDGAERAPQVALGHAAQVLRDRALGALRRARSSVGRALLALKHAGIPPWLAGACAAGATLLVLFVWLVARGEETGAMESTPPAASQLEARVEAVIAVAEPTATGRDPVVAPAKDGRIVDGRNAASWRAQLRSFVEAEDWSRAGRAVEALVELDEEAFTAPAIVAAVVSTAVALESVGGEPADRVFDALTTRLGPKGLDVLFEIVRTRGATKGSQRAAELLADPDVARRASPGLRIAFDLSRAPCADKPALFARAVEEGDQRTLTTLRALREAECPRRGNAACCFREHAELRDAVQKLRERLRK